MAPRTARNRAAIELIVTHAGPDLDALLSPFLIQTKGLRHNPPLDARTSQIYFGMPTPEIQSLLDAGRAVAVDLDVQGRYVFDHHQSGSRYRSSAEKVARELRIYHSRGIRELVDLVSQADQGLAGREPLVQWARAVSWWSRDEPDRVYGLFAQLFQGIVAMRRGEKPPQLDWDVDGWIGDHFPMTPEMNRVLRPTLRAIRSPELPGGRYEQRLAVKELVTALRHGSPGPSMFDRSFELLLYSLLEWQLEGERGKAEAERAECIEVGGVKIAYGEYTSDRFTEWLRRMHHPQITIGVNPERQIAGIAATIQSPITLYQVAAVVRRSEAKRRHQRLQPNLSQKGDLHGWFLHDSGNLLLCGSRHHEPKDGPTQIELTELVEFVSSTLRAPTLEREPCAT